MTDFSERIFLLSRRWPHHSSHSGYDRLACYVGQKLMAAHIPAALLPEPVVRSLFQNVRGYDKADLILEIQAALHMATHRNCLYHVLYGDTCYNYLGQLEGWRGHRIIATFHHPPGKFAEMVPRTEPLTRLAAAIIVGRNQFANFDGVLPPEKVFFVPHAVDTSFFVPPSGFAQRQENLCLFVGAHLRDFRTLRSIIENARILAPHLKFIIVAHPKHLDYFRTIVGNYSLKSKIPEQELLALYQRATVLIQPLLDSTANTAILEAMSCGLPMVTTDVGAVRNYVTEKCAMLVPPFNPEAFLEVIICLVNSAGKRQSMAKYARNRALEFDFQRVASKLNLLYTSLLSEA